MILAMVNLNPTEATTTVGSAAQRTSQAVDTEVRVTPKDMVEINMAVRLKVRVTIKDMEVGPMVEEINLAVKPKVRGLTLKDMEVEEINMAIKAVDTGLVAEGSADLEMYPAETTKVMQAVVTPKGIMATEVVDTDRRTRDPKANSKALAAS